MSVVTKNVAAYVKKLGISVAKVARETGIDYRALHASLSNDKRNRSLRDDELIAVCRFLGVNPMEFAEAKRPTLNEMRAEYGLSPIEGGDVVLTPIE